MRIWIVARVDSDGDVLMAGAFTNFEKAKYFTDMEKIDEWDLYELWVEQE